MTIAAAYGRSGRILIGATMAFMLCIGEGCRTSGFRETDTARSFTGVSTQATDSVVRAVRSLWRAARESDLSAMHNYSASGNVVRYLESIAHDSVARLWHPRDFAIEDLRWVGPEAGTYAASFVLPGDGCEDPRGVKQSVRVGFLLRRDLGWRISGVFHPNRECSRP